MSIKTVKEFDPTVWDPEYPNTTSSFKWPALSHLWANDKTTNQIKKKLKIELRKYKKQLREWAINQNTFDLNIERINNKLLECENYNEFLVKQREKKVNETRKTKNKVSYIPELKEKIHIVIIDDLIEVREKIKNLLPDVLDNYEVSITEIDNYNDAEEEFRYSSIYSEKVFYILDNNFYEKSWDNFTKANTWFKLYNWIKTNKAKEFLKNIAIFSSSEKEEIEQKFGKNIKIIPWKWTKYSDSIHIDSISEWIKESLGDNQKK